MVDFKKMLDGISTDEVQSWVERFVTAHEQIAKALVKISGKTAGKGESTPAGTDRPAVEGIVTNIEERGEWVTATLAQDNGYNTWLSSKDADKINPLISAYRTGARIRVSYTEKKNTKEVDGKTKTYTNRYVTAIEVVKSGGARQGAASASAVADDEPF